MDPFEDDGMSDAPDGRLTPSQVKALRQYHFSVSAKYTLADAVIIAVREAVLDGVLRPGTGLNEQEIATALDVSRTPVREALRRLDAEELTIKKPGMPRVVAPMTTDDVLAVYLVREVLEGLAARLAATKCTPEHLLRLKEVNEEFADISDTKDHARATALNLKFHRLIRQASGNSYLDRFLVQVEQAVRRIPHSTFEYPGRMGVAFKEHQALIDAISAGNAVEAERVACLHMRGARERRIMSLLE
jgi:DNA-binding GntR family transcriptional regulator